MSTECNHYVIYGYSLKWENTDHLDSKHYNDNPKQTSVFDAFDKYSDSAYEVAKPKTFIVLDDGRDGQHLLIGICLQATKEYQGFDGVLTCEVSAKDKKLLNQKVDDLAKELPSYYNLFERLGDQKPKFHVVSHYR